MSQFETNWGKEEFTAYVLLYCAQADSNVSEEEITIIKTKVDEEQFKSVKSEFESDNDYKRIQKIKNTVTRYGFSAEDMQILFDDMKKIFHSDGKFDLIERKLFNMLKRILS